jgi:hypothetical protein
MSTYTVRVYTCKKHPTWSLEDRSPVMASGLKVVCPLCREEFIIANIGLAECKAEKREAAP